ncbi:WASH complex subunit 1 [Diaphorina citri]|jgi:hypothetical protein|uniref:WASH complex subunit 1 n=1 Tax=Diaphorina citri TaxID=121845 RepID=A0A1S3DCW0_DIACI|nr:WASH complex subunit 1 [Diaphorina citri]KAI5756094.1 hypothetical protein M8J77_022022 [Diaphorina citri]
MIKITNIEIALIQDDLKHNDTIIQIANSLDILDESMRNVFDHTKKSIWRTRQCLHAIEKRSSVVCANIEKLKNIQKSVTIVSKSKYPYPYNGNYSVHIQHEHVTPMYKCPLLLYDKTEINTRDIDNKLKFYHVKTNNMLHKNVELVCEESLGKLPAPIDSVMSSILFNTSDNVYEKYIIVHPGQVIARKPITKKHDHTEQVKMEDAPKSLSEADDILARKHTFTYSPSLDTIPVIELPVDLPDLIGFAHDFRYTGDNNIGK